nr:zinc ABC transporter substrate-binding protein [uncultured Pseudodesulfovibrio sp.]
MKKFLIVGLLMAFISLWARTGIAGNPEEKIVVLTSLGAVQAMAEVLTENTSITVMNSIPQGYSMRGQDAYFKKHREAFFQSAAKADAVLTVGSAWPADPLYKWARRSNIRVVNIDATRPLDEYGAGVPLVTVQGKNVPFVWRSPANMTRMGAITADDLSRLVPAEASTIKVNLKRMQSVLFRIRSKYEAAFTDLESVDIAALTGAYTPLIDEFGLDVIVYALKPEVEWTENDAKGFAEQLKSGGIKAVACAWEPDEKVRKALLMGGAVPVVLEKFVRESDVEPILSLSNWYERNLSRLLVALQD